ncbi:MAG: hypothetical protein NC218_01920 [Acetobacter sp.]|nr:hypothetical protein [Acetobacter sp.]
MNYEVIYKNEEQEVFRDIFQAKDDKEALIKVIDRHGWGVDDSNRDELCKAHEVDLIVAVEEECNDSDKELYFMKNIDTGRVLVDNFETKQDNEYREIEDMK